jgi:hypothetical protein
MGPVDQLFRPFAGQAEDVVFAPDAELEGLVGQPLLHGLNAVDLPFRHLVLAGDIGHDPVAGICPVAVVIGPQLFQILKFMDIARLFIAVDGQKIQILLQKMLPIEVRGPGLAVIVPEQAPENL